MVCKFDLAAHSFAEILFLDVNSEAKQARIISSPPASLIIENTSNPNIQADKIAKKGSNERITAAAVGLTLPSAVF